MLSSYVRRYFDTIMKRFTRLKKQQQLNNIRDSCITAKVYTVIFRKLFECVMTDKREITCHEVRKLSSRYGVEVALCMGSFSSLQPICSSSYLKSSKRNDSNTKNQNRCLEKSNKTVELNKWCISEKQKEESQSEKGEAGWIRR